MMLSIVQMLAMTPLLVMMPMLWCLRWQEPQDVGNYSDVGNDAVMPMLAMMLWCQQRCQCWKWCCDAHASNDTMIPVPAAMTWCLHQQWHHDAGNTADAGNDANASNDAVIQRPTMTRWWRKQSLWWQQYEIPAKMTIPVTMPWCWCWQWYHETNVVMPTPATIQETIATRAMMPMPVLMPWYWCQQWRHSGSDTVLLAAPLCQQRYKMWYRHQYCHDVG